MRRGMRLLVAFGLLAGLLPLLPVGVVVADNAVVAAPCDDDAFDAALAIAQTNGGGTITFACGGATTINVDNTKTIATGNTVVIEGADLITFDGGDATQLFVVQSGATLELHNLVLNNGSSGGGGGAILNSGTLDVTASTFNSNDADQGGAIQNDIGGTATVTASTFSGNSARLGGAILNFQGTLEVTASTFNGNSAEEGGAINNNTDSTGTVTASTFSGNNATVAGGAIMNWSSLTVTTSTFSGNDSAGSFGGGAIINFTFTTPPIATITASTFSGNSSTSGPGGALASISGTMTVERTILAAGPSGGNCGVPITSTGYNLSDDATCNLTQPTDIQNSTSINLGALTGNGGPTQTHLPLAGSDAIDNGPATCASPDQRGQPRPSGVACDIGSVEVQAPSATFALCVDRYTGRVLSSASGQCTPNQMALDVAGTASLAFCIDPYTGIVYYSFGRPCNPPRQTHIVPDDGDLLTCVNIYTAVNRKVVNHGQCTPMELPNTITSTP